MWDIIISFLKTEEGQILERIFYTKGRSNLIALASVFVTTLTFSPRTGSRYLNTLIFITCQWLSNRNTKAVQFISNNSSNRLQHGKPSLPALKLLMLIPHEIDKRGKLVLHSVAINVHMYLFHCVLLSPSSSQSVRVQQQLHNKKARQGCTFSNCVFYFSMHTWWPNGPESVAESHPHDKMATKRGAHTHRQCGKEGLLG